MTDMYSLCTNIVCVYSRMNLIGSMGNNGARSLRRIVKDL